MIMRVIYSSQSGEGAYMSLMFYYVGSHLSFADIREKIMIIRRREY
jgi:hypothetical protein